MKGLRAAVDESIFFKNSQGKTGRGILLKLNRSTIVLEVYNPYSIVQLSEVLSDLKIQRGNKLIYNGKAVVSNLVNTGLVLIVSASLVDPWLDLSELNTPDSINTEVEHFIHDWNSSVDHLIPGYQLVVGKIRSFLLEFHRWLEQFDVDEYDKNQLDLMYDELLPPLRKQLTGLHAEFEEQIKLIPAESLNVHKAYAQRNIHPLILRSPFIHRTFHKPLGYAGDYEMVNMMLRDPREGESLYTQLVNTYYLKLPATQAHRNRIELLNKIINEEVEKSRIHNQQFKAMNIGCGPAEELQRFSMQQHRVHCQFDLLDFNQETLGYAEKKITSVSGNQEYLSFNFIYKSVHDLLKESMKPETSDRINTYNLVYCAGLFDYLNDKICTRLLRLFYSWVKPGGLVVATNVHSKSEDRGTMEHIAEWYLVYRDEKNMLGLADDLEYSEIFSEETGINLFLSIRKPLGIAE